MNYLNNSSDPDSVPNPGFAPFGIPSTYDVRISKQTNDSLKICKKLLQNINGAQIFADFFFSGQLGTAADSPADFDLGGTGSFDYSPGNTGTSGDINDLDAITNKILNYRTNLITFGVSGIHQGGGCNIGNDPTDGVVDQELKVFGTSNVRVADNSIWPLQFACHTAAPAMLAGLRAAEFALGL